MEQTGAYIDRLGSLDTGDIENKSLSDIKTIIKNEVDTHKKTLADKTQDTENNSCKFYFYFIKGILSGLLLPLFDIGSDVATSVTHYKWENYGWCILTLFFVFLPGLVIGLVIAIKGLRKRISVQRVINFSIVLFALPFLYPFIQILVNVYMIYLLFHHRNHEVVKIMGHDVKQFKSLEGFLESGPQFVLQSYIILRGDKQGIEDFDSVDAKRLAILCVTIVLSFASLTKTGCNVNTPDPDENRKSTQNITNAPKFLWTSIPFHFFIVLFRVSCLAYFCAVYSKWTTFIILGTILINMIILYFASGSSPTITILLGTVSVFMPNGYLLYNFAATFLVDMTYKQTRLFYILELLIVNICYFILLFITLDGVGNLKDLGYIPEKSVLSQSYILITIVLCCGIAGALALIFAFIHWQFSISPLYQDPMESTENKVDDQNGHVFEEIALE